MHAGFLERADLVVHQRDQRADDDGDAVPGAVARDRRHLVAQALAAAGGHQHQRVAAGRRRARRSPAARRGRRRSRTPRARTSARSGGELAAARGGVSVVMVEALYASALGTPSAVRRAPFEGRTKRGRAGRRRASIIVRNLQGSKEPPWPRSTKSSSSATSAAIRKCATRPTAAPSATSASRRRAAGRTRTSGDKSEETEWHRVVFYDKLAEIAGEYLKKGRSVYVEGRLKTRKWQDKDGVEKYTTEIIATDMQMLGSREGMGGGAGSRRGRRLRARRRPPRAPPRRRRTGRPPSRRRLQRHGRRHPVLECNLENLSTSGPSARAHGPFLLFAKLP